jgi:DNA-directed RNA polymerase subunit RPC12/RpoP
MTLNRSQMEQALALCSDEELLERLLGEGLTPLGREVAEAECAKRGLQAPDPAVEEHVEEEPPAPGVEWAMLGEFTDSAEAFLLGHRLEQEGIAAHVAEFHMGTLQPGVAFRLMVDAAQLEQARAKMGELEAALQEDEVEFCPNCGSRQVQEDRPGMLEGLKALLALRPDPVNRRCVSCGHRFRI